MEATAIRKVIAYLRLVRWPNLLMVAALLLGLRLFVLNPLAAIAEAGPSLTFTQWLLLTLDVLIVVAVGNAFNDIRDVEADRVNRPERPMVSGVLVSAEVKSVMFFLAAVGAIVTLFLGVSTDNLPWMALFPGALSLLLAYDKWGKRWGYLGNILVSALIAAVPWFLVVAEYDFFVALGAVNSALYQALVSVLLVFTGLVFFTNVAREIAKDAHDLEGDRQVAAKSIPIFFGRRKTSIIIGAHLLVVLGCEVGLIVLVRLGLLQNALVFGIIFMIFYLLRLCLVSDIAADFESLSKGMKWLMVVGLLQLFTIPYNLLFQY